MHGWLKFIDPVIKNPRLHEQTGIFSGVRKDAAGFFA